MKNLFGFDGKNKINYNSEFIIRDLDSVGDTKKLDELWDNNFKAIKNTFFPLWVSLSSFLALFAGLIMVIVGIPENGAAITYTDLILLILGGVLAVYGITVIVINHVRGKRLYNNPNYQQSIKDEERLTFEALKVPENADYIDILIADKPSKSPVYRLQPMKVFKENGLLCFAAEYWVTGIPLSQITTAYSVNERTRFFGMEKFSKEKRIKYGITRPINGGYDRMVSRLVVEVQLNGEQFEIVVAGYDAEAFTRLLDKTAVII